MIYSRVSNLNQTVSHFPAKIYVTTCVPCIVQAPTFNILTLFNILTVNMSCIITLCSVFVKNIMECWKLSLFIYISKAFQLYVHMFLQLCMLVHSPCYVRNNGRYSSSLIQRVI